MILGQLNAITHELATITAVSGGPTTQASDSLQQAFNQERMIKFLKNNLVKDFLEIEAFV